MDYINKTLPRTQEEIYYGIEGLNAGDCIRTNSGIYMNVFEPTSSMLNIEDIAHSLSNQCRFSGHLPQFYSVAQHCVETAKRVKELTIERNLDGQNYYWPEQVPTKGIELQALMHDASEAYLLDIPTPIKRRISNYSEYEYNMMVLIGRTYGFSWPMDEIIKEVDAEMLVFEWECLMVKTKPLPNGFKVMNNEEAKAAFLEYFNSLV